MIVKTVDAAQINLVLQVAIFIILSASIRELKKKRNFPLHGSMMAIAVVLNFISFLLVMGPSLIGLQEFVLSKPLNILSIVTLLHASFGALAEVFGVWTVISWRLHSPVKYCMSKKKLMRAIIVLWLISLFSGFVFYALLYMA